MKRQQKDSHLSEPNEPKAKEAQVLQFARNNYGELVPGALGGALDVSENLAVHSRNKPSSCYRRLA
jgi:hypothetical protein